MQAKLLQEREGVSVFQSNVFFSKKIILNFAAKFLGKKVRTVPKGTKKKKMKMKRKFIAVPAIFIALAVSNQLPAQNDSKDIRYNMADSTVVSEQATQTNRVKRKPETGDTPYEYCYGKNLKCAGSECSEIKVITPSNSDVLVTLKQNEKVVAHAYICAGNSYTFELPNGTYQPFFYFGSHWNSETEMTKTTCGSLRGRFTQNEHFGKDTPEELDNDVLTYELILQQSGNFSTIPSNSDEAF